MMKLFSFKLKNRELSALFGAIAAFIGVLGFLVEELWMNIDFRHPFSLEFFAVVFIYSFGLAILPSIAGGELLAILVDWNVKHQKLSIGKIVSVAVILGGATGVLLSWTVAILIRWRMDEILFFARMFDVTVIAAVLSGLVGLILARQAIAERKI